MVDGDGQNTRSVCVLAVGEGGEKRGVRRGKGLSECFVSPVRAHVCVCGNGVRERGASVCVCLRMYCMC